MMKQEFEEKITPMVNNGIGGAVSDEAWADIELVYMNLVCDKKYVADLFWNHPGKFSEVVKYVKRFLELKEAKLAARKAKLEAEIAYAEANEALTKYENRLLQDKQILFY